MTAEPRILQFPRRTGAFDAADEDDGDVTSSRMLRRALCAVTPIITGALDENFLTPLIHELVTIFSGSRGSIMLLDVPGDAATTLRMTASSGLAPEIIRREADKDGVAVRVVRDARPTLIFDRADRDVRFLGVVLRDEVGAAMCAPIATPTGVVFGVVNISRERGADCAGFSRGDLEICDAIAMLVGDALERLAARKSEAELRERIRAVERLSMMGEVAAGIAHEVATPMSCVRTNIVTLIRYFEELKPYWHPPETGYLSEMCADLPIIVSDIREGVERAEQVMARMKRMARLERGPRLPFFAQTAVDGALRLVRPRLRASLVLDVAGDASAVGSDVDLIQVLVNLLVNADDAIALRQLREQERGVRAREGEIRIRGFVAEDVVVVEVEDNGTGIAVENLGRVFQPLFTTKHAGTGLGLSISRRLIDEASGRLSVSSAVDVGTTFRIVLPRA